MLRCYRTALGGLAAALAATFALNPAAAKSQDDEPEDSFRRPSRLTAGGGDQLLGQLSPDEKTLYFVTSRNTTSEIFVQDLEEGRARRLFDEEADVSWPRVSPDGRSILYVSYREEASGQLCVRDLPGGGGRRCLTGATGAQQAEWVGAHRMALVCRSDARGDLRVVEVTDGATLSARPLLDRGVTNPAISPNARWLVYVPTERATEAVGPAFAARAGRRLEALRLDRVGKAVPFEIDLPGVTAQPAFSRDGESLYLVQFTIDTNGDGVIDASDHGILFRVPFPTEQDSAPAVAAGTEPEQLTDSGWNCQYPAPADHRLILTCSRRGALDVYELPLDGELPARWDDARLREELDLASHRSEELLLYRHRLRLATDVRQRRLLMARLLRVHLGYDDIDAAAFYAAKIRALRDPQTAGLGQALTILVAQRKERRDRELGRSVGTFDADSRSRLEQLRAAGRASPAGAAIGHVVASEIAGALGDIVTAKKELEAARIDAMTPQSVLELYAERADALYRQLDDRPALWDAECRLAEHPAFRPEERLAYARVAVRSLLRGLSREDALSAIARVRSRARPASDLAFALDLAATLLGFQGTETNPASVAALQELYSGQVRMDRRRAVMLEAVQRAAQVGADQAVEALASRYLAETPAGSGEHRRARRVYRQAVLGRAFRRLAQGRTAEAQADFEAVMHGADSLEAAFEAIHLRLEKGESETEIVAALKTGGLSTPVDHFVRAYLLARHRPDLPVAERERHAKEARALLRSDWDDLRDAPLARDLYAATLVEDYLRTGALADAERAGNHFLVALELSEGEPRYTGMILGQLGLLHAAVGNFRLALDYLEQRDHLPYPDDVHGMATRLTRARVLFHVGNGADAAAVADAALERADSVADLASYRLLAVDRDALYNLAAHRFVRAASLYDRELGAVETAPASEPENLFHLHLARAAALIGAGQPRRAFGDLDVVDRLLTGPALGPRLSWAQAAPLQALASYRLIAAGLRANAARLQGDLAAAGRALEARRAGFADQVAQAGLDRDLGALVLVDGRLAENACRRGDVARAASWLGDALVRSDTLASRTGAQLAPDLLDVLWFSGELSALDGAKLPFDVAARLRDASERLRERKGARWRAYRRWFEILIALQGS